MRLLPREMTHKRRDDHPCTQCATVPVVCATIAEQTWVSAGNLRGPRHWAGGPIAGRSPPNEKPHHHTNGSAAILSDRPSSPTHPSTQVGQTRTRSFASLTFGRFAFISR
jgi:hypothetical protein